MGDRLSKAKVIAEAVITHGHGAMRWVAMVLIVVIIGLQVTHQFQIAKHLDNDTSPLADGYSERNELSAGTSYALKGFTKYMGLPDHEYKEGEEPGRLYLRYPQGPALILGFAIKIFGQNRVATYRMIAIGFRLGCLVLLAYVLVNAFGSWSALFFFAALWQIPMSYNMMHGLGQNSYQVSLLYLQLAVAIYYLIVKNGHFDWRLAAVLFVIGFCHGALSLDFCFVATFAAIPFGIILQARSLTSHGILRITNLVVPVGCGFVFAFSLHALQVILYYDFAFWFEDLTSTARQRSDGVAAATRTGVFLDYHFRQLPSSIYLGTTVQHLASLFIPFVALTSLRIGKEAFELPLRHLSRAIGAGIAAYAVSSLWLLAMPTHAWIHTHFIPRHYLLFAITILLAATVGLASAGRAYSLMINTVSRTAGTLKPVCQGFAAAIAMLTAWMLPFFIVAIVVSETKERTQSRWQVHLYRSSDFQGSPLIEHIDSVQLPAKQGFGLIHGTTGALSYRFLTCAVLLAPAKIAVSTKADLESHIVVNGTAARSTRGQDGEQLSKIQLPAGRNSILVEATAHEIPTSGLTIHVRADDGVEVPLEMPRRSTSTENFCI